MDIHNLVHMANRIGQFFQAMPDQAEATAGVAEHIRKFWEPRMRRALLAHADTAAGADLLPLVREALRVHRPELA
jgi:formate dehydrogenase subunit delta